MSGLVGGVVLPPQAIRRRASSSSTTTTTSAATPSATSSRVGGRRIIGYGGSQSIQSPNSLFGAVAKGLLRDLGVDIRRFETAFERDALFIARPLARRVLSARGLRPRRAGGGRCPRMECRRGHAPAAATRGRCRSSSADFPISEASKAQISRSIDRAAIRSPAATRRGEARAPQEHQLSRLPDQDLRLQRGGCELSSRAARSASSGSAATRCRRRTCATWAIRALPGLACRQHERRVERALHLSFPRRQRLARASAGALAHPRHRARAAPWRTWCWRRSTTASSTIRAAGPHPAQFDLSRRAQRRRRGAGRLRARRRAAPRRGAARGARLLPHGHPAHHAGIAGGAARGAGARTSRRRSSIPTSSCATGAPS